MLTVDEQIEAMPEEARTLFLEYMLVGLNKNLRTLGAALPAETVVLHEALARALDAHNLHEMRIIATGFLKATRDLPPRPNPEGFGFQVNFGVQCSNCKSLGLFGLDRNICCHEPSENILRGFALAGVLEMERRKGGGTGAT